MSIRPARRFKIGLLGLSISYAVLVTVVLVAVVVRGSKAQKVDGVSRPPWPLQRPAVSYLASGTLPAGHRVREEDLRPPLVSPNLASALPDKRKFIGKYVQTTIKAGAPVSADSLLNSPITPALPPGQRRLRIPIDSSVVNRVNPGKRVWLTRSDTVIARAEVEHLICQGGKCDAHLLVDSAAVSHFLRVGMSIPRLGIILPFD
jgi:Flp pilus assembly protein CpaB